MKQIIIIIGFLYCMAGAGQVKDATVIYADKESSYKQNTLDKLQEGDSVIINFWSSGCFHSSSSELTIIKKDGKFMAELLDGGQPLFRNGKKLTLAEAASLFKTVVLNEEQIRSFIRFENELNKPMDNGCTTVDTYKIRSKYLNVDKTDGSCSWNGFNRLVNSFFGQAE